MGKNVKVIEENETLTLKYVDEISLRSLLWLLFFFTGLISLFFSSSFSDFGLETFSFALILGMFTCVPFFLQTREVNLTIGEKFITIEYPSNDSKEKTQKMFANEDIKRIYSLNSNKNQNSPSYNRYELWIENYQGEKTKILGKQEGFVVKDENDIIETLDKITDFFDKKRYFKARKTAIQKISVPKVKVAKRTPTKTFIAPRQITKEQDTAKLKIQDFREGVLVDFHNEHWEIIGQVQYDWKLDNTDTLYQIKNQRNQISLLFVAQNMAVYTAWIEERVPQYELMDNQLDKISENLPRKFKFRESVFLKEHFNTGHEFVSKSKSGVKIKQWKYLSEDRKESLRILEHEDKDTFVFWGEKIEEFEFSNILKS